MGSAIKHPLKATTTAVCTSAIADATGPRAKVGFEGLLAVLANAYFVPFPDAATFDQRTFKQTDRGVHRSAKDFLILISCHANRA